MIDGYLGQAILLVILLFFGSPAGAQVNPHDKIRESLVYIKIYAETIDGVPIESFGTGVVASSDGVVITSYHLFKAISQANVIPETIKITGHISLKTSVGYDAHIVDKLEGRDIAKIDLIGAGNNAFTPACFERSTRSIVPDGETIYTSGFPKSSSFIATDGNVLNIDGIRGSFTTNIESEDGQSGSPVYNESSHIIGVLKGHDENNLMHSIVIPVRDFINFLPPDPQICTTASPLIDNQLFISGEVRSAENGYPIEDAYVILPEYENKSVFTEKDGSFYFDLSDFPINSSTMIKLIVNKKCFMPIERNYSLGGDSHTIPLECICSNEECNK